MAALGPLVAVATAKGLKLDPANSKKRAASRRFEPFPYGITATNLCFRDEFCIDLNVDIYEAPFYKACPSTLTVNIGDPA